MFVDDVEVPVRTGNNGHIRVFFFKAAVSVFNILQHVAC